jgi:protein-disulfide isomerase
MKKTPYLLIVAVILGIAGGAYAYFGQNSGAQEATPEDIPAAIAAPAPVPQTDVVDSTIPSSTEKTGPEKLVVTTEDHIVGSDTAPVTIIEYASLTCSHCATFHKDIYPKIKTDYIDTGKVRFVFRNFPLDGKALRAASLAACMPRASYFAFLSILFQNQSAWAFANDDDKTILQYAKLGGLDEERGKACLNDTQMQDKLIALRTEGTTLYGIQSTPSFVINTKGNVSAGAKPYDEFKLLIDAALAKTNTNQN